LTGLQIAVKSFKEERGIVFIAVMFLTLILAVSGLSYLSMGAYEGNLVGNQVESSHAFEAAEAGMEQALWRLSRDCVWEDWPDNRPEWVDDWGNEKEEFFLSWSGGLNDDLSCTVKIKNNNDLDYGRIFVINASGKIDSTMIPGSIVKRSIAMNNGYFSDEFDYVLSAGGSIWPGGSGNLNFSGTQQSGVDINISFPGGNFDGYYSKFVNYSFTESFSGDLTLDSDSLRDTTRLAIVDGNVVIRFDGNFNKCRDITIVAIGDIIVDRPVNQGFINENKRLSLIADGDINILATHGLYEIRIDGTIFATNDVIIWGWGTINGHIIAYNNIRITVPDLTSLNISDPGLIKNCDPPSGLYLPLDYEADNYYAGSPFYWREQ